MGRKQLEFLYEVLKGQTVGYFQTIPSAGVQSSLKYLKADDI